MSKISEALIVFGNDEYRKEIEVPRLKGIFIVPFDKE